VDVHSGKLLASIGGRKLPARELFTSILMRPHRGGLILALGILAFVLCGIFTAIPAWIMGNSDLKAMDAGQMDPSGRGLTQAGKIFGMIAILLNVVGLVVVIILVATGVLAAASGVAR
jgi:hypothetical protein